MTANEQINEPAKQPELRGQTLIFVSHDSRDAELAEAFSKLLSSVSAGVLKSFRSSDRKGSQGIEYGVEWYPELMSKLESASDVVCLLTQRSLERPWILYEAGVAKGKLSTPVYGIALGIPLSKASSGPFAQFQNCDDSAENLTQLVMQLVRRIPGSEPDRDAVEMQVRTFTDRANTALTKLAASGSVPDEELTPDTSVAKLFEEVKVMFQDLPSRIEHRVTDRSVRSKRWRRLQPMMLRDMSEVISGVPGDVSGLLILGSVFREDFPWLYELCLDAYRCLKTEDYAQASDAVFRLQRAADFTLHGPMAEDVSKEMQIMLMDFPLLIENIIGRQMHGVLPKDSKVPARKS
jgi:hypothetical protein